MNDKSSASGPLPNPTDLRLIATAYHEAGHAVMALTLGRPIQKITIAPGQMQVGGVRLGVCQIQKGRFKPSKDSLEDEVLILFAGMVAESHFTGTRCHQGASQDIMAIRRLLQHRAPNERTRERLERRLLDKTEYLLSDEQHSQAIQLIAQELICKTTISGRAARHFFELTVREE
jgi:ATP-dependent Zn protease